jgi:peptide/nickel transport system ATP-binding protein
MALLAVEDLHVSLPTSRGPAAAVRDVSFAIERGDTLGLVGESGSGKTLTALAILNLLPEHATLSGRVCFNDVELTACSDAELCRIRGNRIAMIFQEPLAALNPLQRIGHQIAEPLQWHRGFDQQAARSEARRLLDRVGIAEAARRLNAYPHELSGGQRQRVTIAMALTCRPDILIADEPTSALDLTVQRQILDLIGQLVEQEQMALILISHDLGVIAENARRMLVMYGGTIVENAPTRELLAQPAHPYTRALFGARLTLGTSRLHRLATIPGSVPDIGERDAGCPFAGRCPLTVSACRAFLPRPEPVAPAHTARCIRLDAAQKIVTQA